MSASFELAVLGGSGFVGAALLRAASAAGVPARALERRAGSVARLPGVTPIAGSLEALPPALLAPGERPLVVAHFATVQLDPAGRGFGENLRGVERLLGALGPSVRGLLYGSSLSVAGQQPQRGEREEQLPPRPGTALARSRAACEAAVLAAAAARGLSAVCTRPRFVLGRGDRHTLPGLLRLTRRGLRLGSGRQAFSVIDVDDYGRLLVQLAARLAAGPPLVRPLHVAYRRPLTLGELQQALQEGFGLPPPRRALWLPGPALALLRALPLASLRALVTRYELVGRDHHVDVSALEALVGGDIVGRDPREALAAAVAALAREGEAA